MISQIFVSLYVHNIDSFNKVNNKMKEFPPPWNVIEKFYDCIWFQVLLSQCVFMTVARDCD
jgi:hypothetical protein